MTKKSRHNLKYLENRKSFEVKLKAFIFKGLSVAKNCLKPESGLLAYSQNHHLRNPTFKPRGFYKECQQEELI